MKVFLEQQKFNQPLVIIALYVAFIVVIGSIISKWEELSTGDTTGKIEGTIGLLIIILVAMLFYHLKLKTRIDEKGIGYQFSPFHLKPTAITWNLISKCYIRKYKGFTEFGGWGMKRRIYGKGRCYTTKGNIGLQLELKNGKQVLIGTQKKEELQRVLKTYQHKLIKE